MSGQMYRFYVRLLIAVSFLTFLMSTPVVGKVIYVDDDANAPGDGKSWVTAYRYLQDALADARAADKPVEIRVAQGLYKPDERANQTAGEREFQLISGVALQGGYAGLSALDPNAREIQPYRTILSGDLGGDDKDVNDLRDLLTRTGNSRTVVTCYQVDKTALLDGVTITGGNYSIYSDFRPVGGGGIVIGDSDVTIANCTFTNNSAAQGGGAVLIRGGHPTFTNCTFTKNYAGSGGAIVGGDKGATITNCTFTGNGAYAGGAVAEYQGIISNCTFRGNSAESGGGALNACGGPITRCLFINNSAGAYAGALAVASRSGSALITGCLFSHNTAGENGGAVDAAFLGDSLTFRSCVFDRNKAGGWGGGMFIHSTPNAILVNCSFWANSATNGSGVTVYTWHPTHPLSNLKLTNCILWDTGDEIWQNDKSTINVRYSDVRGGYGGVGNIDADPLFADPNNADFHLKSQAGRWAPSSQRWVTDDVTSPCIDAGDPNSPIGEEPFPNGGRINMGAYGGTEEASKSYFGGLACKTIIAGDINGDCKVDFRDLAIMAMHWLKDRTPHHIVTTTYRLVEDKSSVVSYGGRRIEKHAIAGTFDLTIDFTAAKAMFERVDVTSDQTMSFIDYRKEGEPIYTDELDRMFHMTQLVSTDVNDTEARFVFHKNIPSFPGADIHVTVAFEGDSVSIAGKFSDPVADGRWHDLNAVAVPVRDP